MASASTNTLPCVAVVGSGYWGKNLVRNFSQLHALKLVCDKNKTKLAQSRIQYPDVEMCLDYNEVMQRKDISAVVIATPSETHFALAREALGNKKHVFVEKPLALKEKDGQQLVELANKNGLILMVGHILYYHPAVIKLKELIDSGELGKIQYLYSNRLNIGKIRAEENILWSFAPHDISVILMLLGEMPETIYASGGSYLQQAVPDTTLSFMDFPGGVKAHIFVSWLHPFKEQKLVVVGDQKMAVFDDLSENKISLYPHKVKWLKRIPVASKAEVEVVQVDMEEPLKIECQHFLDCLETGKIPRTDGREGLRVLQILQASQASLDRNSSIIRLDQDSKSSMQRPLSSDSTAPGLLSTQDRDVHESAYIDENAKIGAGTKIWHFSHVLSGSEIGKNCNIGQNVCIGPHVVIGNNCKIQNNVSVYKGVTLEDNVFCGPSMVFTNVFDPRASISKMDQLRPTLVQTGATIGANATIVCGTTLGQYCFIGAGAVVTKDVSNYALVVGNPAKHIDWVCKCGHRLGDDFQCAACGLKFESVGDQIREKGIPA